MIAVNYLLPLYCFTCLTLATAVATHSSHQSRPQWQVAGEDEGRVSPTSGDRLWHNNNRLHHQHTDWCTKDCTAAASGSSSNSSQQQHHICASDGRVYRSMCELKRHSCRHNVHLRRRPATFCSIASDVVGSSETTTTKRDERVRIVELKKLCDAHEYDQMKRSLLAEFNGNLGSMFRYFDTNGDGRIEAHELWPQVSQDDGGGGGGGAKLIYAQVWDNHTAHCPQQQQTSQGDNNNRGGGDQCWYFLDFAFQPHNATQNPCSLSHLMLFDLKHPNHQFDFETFARAFANFTQQQNSTTTTTITKSSKVVLRLGDDADLECRFVEDENKHVINKDNEVDSDQDPNQQQQQPRCMWTRYNSNLAASRDPHVSITSSLARRQKMGHASEQLKLHVRDAQLYLSGHYKCICHIQRQQPIDFEHTHHLQVLAEPRVRVLPHYQWSLPKSRVSFECHYDQISTQSNGLQDNKLVGGDSGLSSQFGLSVEWTTRGEQVSSRSRRSDDLLVDQLLEFSSAGSEDNDQSEDDTTEEDRRCNSSSRISATKAISKLSIDDLQLCDSTLYTCRVELPQRSSLSPDKAIFSEDSGRLLVQDKPAADDRTPLGEEREVSALWILHENGVSIYRIQADDGQEMELVREISGHSPISSSIEGNWNQLTLCGGLNSDQAVICEWSDNAVLLAASDRRRRTKRPGRKYVYVGQPNLNRVVVFDSLKFELVAIINTEPQPRRLHLYEPNRIHLSKWVKRRLSPIANARWRQQQQQHLFGGEESTPRAVADAGQSSSSMSMSSSSRLNSPESKLLSSARLVGGPQTTRGATNSNVNQTTNTGGEEGDDDADGQSWRAKRAAIEEEDEQVALVQHDIWLLCYGQPLAGLEEQRQSTAASHHHHNHRRRATPRSEQSADSSSSSSYAESSIRFSPNNNNNNNNNNTQAIEPFEPRLRGGFAAPFAWPSSSSSAGEESNGESGNNNKESRLRNRKSVHIIQTTFLPSATTTTSRRRNANDGSVHTHHAPTSPNQTLADQFRRSSVVSTHHIYPAAAAASRQMRRLQRTGLDLVQDLHVPQRPYSMEASPSYKIHFAYVSHYDERRLFRVSMDSYRYDREIDLQDCDPVHVLTTGQGLLVVQCRAPISHSLIGQLVLDQLSSARIEFNANIRAQESYLSPDNRYLVSIFHHSTQTASSSASSESNTKQTSSESLNTTTSQDSKRHSSSSIVYVQTVGVDGLRLQYELKTLFEIGQCSFVWKDGYYAAIFVTSNRKEQQSEILSLRLLDSRLELAARVPGLVSETRHKEQLIVSPPELRLAALTTNQGTFVIDLEENRVSQSLRRHLAPPTLLWV